MLDPEIQGLKGTPTPRRALPDRGRTRRLSDKLEVAVEVSATSVCNASEDPSTAPRSNQPIALYLVPARSASCASVEPEAYTRAATTRHRAFSPARNALPPRAYTRR
ncbi:MAG: hypothetical protein ACLP8S_16615 [Solirubrobacteraceae bacterium]